MSLQRKRAYVTFFLNYMSIFQFKPPSLCNGTSVEQLSKPDENSMCFTYKQQFVVLYIETREGVDLS
jgi:hypothetical protein